MYDTLSYLWRDEKLNLDAVTVSSCSTCYVI